MDGGQTPKRTSTSLGHPFPFGVNDVPPLSESEALETARDVAKTVLAVHASAVDREGRWPADSLRALLDSGLGGLLAPKAVGGCGFGMAMLASICEILGQECASSAICFGMHCVASAVIASKATPEQSAFYLEPIARGTHLSTLALSEPGTGSHFYLPEAQLVQQGDSFVVTGVKSFVTNGGHADSYVISTTTPSRDDSGLGVFSCAVVPNAGPGISWKGDWDGLGMRGNSSIELRLDGVRLPRRALLGQPGDQTWYVFNVVAPFFLMAMAGTYLGVSSAAFEEARVHLAEREQSHTSRPLGSISVLQHRLGVLYGTLERTRQLVRLAGERGDRGEPDALPLLFSAKAEVADCATTMTNEALTILGGKGFAFGSRAHRLMRDARAAHVMSPTTDLLRTWAGRALLNLPILGA